MAMFLWIAFHPSPAVRGWRWPVTFEKQAFPVQLPTNTDTVASPRVGVTWEQRAGL